MNQNNFNEFDINNISNQQNKKPKRKKLNVAAKIAIAVVCVLLAILIALPIGSYIYVQSMLNKVERVEIDNQVSITSEAKAKYKDYINIALLGIDNRADTYDDGRSDAIIILTLDSVHNKIKMTSIARDSYVEIPGRKYKEKITHAYMYGKNPADRAAKAIDAINHNFDMDISDAVVVNFYDFAKIIDVIGGVWIDVSEAERKVLNKTHRNYINKQGLQCDYVEKAGYQLLSGGQALAYSRDRKTGSGDLDRNSRQREVIVAMYDQVKNMKATEIPKLISVILENCTTSLSNKDMLDMAFWAATEKPSIENLGLPDKDCKPKGTMINGRWYYVYDLDIATKKIHDFITEPKSVSSEPTSSNAPSSAG